MPCPLARGSGRGTRQQSFLAEAEGAELGHSVSGWLGADGCPRPAKTSVVPSVGQHLHGAQSRQLHKGVCSDFVDPVVLETAGKTETGLRKELKAAVTLCGKFCPMASDSRCRRNSLFELGRPTLISRGKIRMKKKRTLLQQLPGSDTSPCDASWHSEVQLMCDGERCPVISEPCWFPALLYPKAANCFAQGESGDLGASKQLWVTPQEGPRGATLCLGDDEGGLRAGDISVFHEETSRCLAEAAIHIP